MNDLLRDDIEYIIHCDDKGKIIGPISRNHAHTKGVRETLCHHSTRSMVFNPIIGKYGIQLKNPKKHDSLTAGKRDMGVAGHNSYISKNNEYKYLNFEENLQKEAKEEIGLKINMIKDFNVFQNNCKILRSGSIGYIFENFLHNDGVNKERVGLGFIVTCEDNLIFTDNEVIDFKRLSPEELEKFIKSNKDQICGGLKLVYKKAEEFRKKL